MFPWLSYHAMSLTPRSYRFSCRTLTTLLLAGGIVCSVYTALSCEFFEFQVEPEHELPGRIFVNVTEGYVGLFGFSLTDGACLPQDQGFLPVGFNELFFGAQICAVAAPSFAWCALFLNLLEIVCKFRCSYFLTWLCLVLAVAAQGGTFLVYGQSEFWYVMCLVFVCVCHIATMLVILYYSGLVVVQTIPYSHVPFHTSFTFHTLLFLSVDDGTINCDFGLGAILSLVAAGSYYVALNVYCCMPRIEPYYKYASRNQQPKAGTNNEPLENTHLQEQPQLDMYEDEPEVPEEDHFDPELSFGHGGTHVTESFQNNNTGADDASK